MARACDLDVTKRVMVGNNVSHSNRKTKRRFIPNLHQSSMFSEALGEEVRLRLSASTIRTIEKKHGLDRYLLSQSKSKLTKNALLIRKRIEDALIKKEA